MRAAILTPLRAPLAAVVLACPFTANAQAFAADYSIHPALVKSESFSGAGLSLNAGLNWYAQVAVGRGAQYSPVTSGPGSADALSIAGGYRWDNGQSLSLQLTGGRGADRLGLSLSYDWPRYFVRLSYDSKFMLTPAETLRFSAGMKF
ncbi:hypothetical protein [Caenimonas aquaedulcis]|uniref:Outer membrane protein beta-barrel domain-containing protein n=1 Tax=Caenimonas aquaedulcis TaxID=2793270 RepID=A0A931H1B3_9BURK|nr:hypothetical protein [Caenimonas aquaedulcis]MBG9386736.1 hypothetical protein [Caenimonas aquaedulcis]